MTQQLNWCGQPIREGEGYGGREEHISQTCSQKPAKAAAKHYEVVTESHVREVFGNGSRKLPCAEAVKLLQELTGTHRTTAYRALRVTGRFAQHLHSDGTMLSWR
jgi:hypothetical protein